MLFLSLFFIYLLLFLLKAINQPLPFSFINLKEYKAVRLLNWDIKEKKDGCLFVLLFQAVCLKITPLHLHKLWIQKVDLDLIGQVLIWQGS